MALVFRYLEISKTKSYATCYRFQTAPLHPYNFMQYLATSSLLRIVPAYKLNA